MSIEFFHGVFYHSIRTIALDMRGYNLSERPIGSENYKVSYIVEDIRALIEHSSIAYCYLLL